MCIHKLYKDIFECQKYLEEKTNKKYHTHSVAKVLHDFSVKPSIFINKKLILMPYMFFKESGSYDDHLTIQLFLETFHNPESDSPFEGLEVGDMILWYFRYGYDKDIVSNLTKIHFLEKKVGLNCNKFTQSALDIDFFDKPGSPSIKLENSIELYYDQSLNLETHSAVIYSILELEQNLKGIIEELNQSIYLEQVENKKTQEQSNNINELRTTFLKGWLIGKGISKNYIFDETQKELWDQLSKADKKLFPPLSRKAIDGFFQSNKLINFKIGRRRKVNGK